MQLPALGVQPVDVGNALAKAAQIENFQAAREDRQTRNRLLEMQLGDRREAIEDKRRDLAAKQAPVIARYLGSAKDEAEWKAGVQTLQGLGIDMRNAPAWSPQAPEMVRRAADALTNPKDRYQVSDGTVYDLNAPGGPAAVAGGPKPVPVAPGGALVDPRTGKVLHQAPERPDRTLQEVYDPKSPTGTRLVPRDQAQNMPGKPAVGLTVTRGADGSLEVHQGPVKPGDQLQKPTMNKVEEQILNNTGRLQRLDTIAAQFKPEFLGFKEQALNWGRDMLDKAGVTLDPATKGKMREFYQFRSAAMDDLNMTLKEMSGAAVTESEAQRLLQVIADARDDGPTKFKAKLDQVMRSVKMAQARLFLIRSRGLEAVSKERAPLTLNEIPRMMDARGEELVQGGMDEQTAMQQVAKEFGLAR